MPTIVAVNPISTLYAGGPVPPGASHVHRYSWQRPRWWDYMAFRKIHCPAKHHIPNNYEIDQDGSGRIRAQLDQSPFNVQPMDYPRAEF